MVNFIIMVIRLLSPLLIFGAICLNIKLGQYIFGGSGILGGYELLICIVLHVMLEASWIFKTNMEIAQQKKAIEVFARNLDNLNAQIREYENSSGSRRNDPPFGVI